MQEPIWNAQAIRDLWMQSETRDKGVRDELGLRILVEIAAQLAELNEQFRPVVASFSETLADRHARMNMIQREVVAMQMSVATCPVCTADFEPEKVGEICPQCHTGTPLVAGNVHTVKRNAFP